MDYADLHTGYEQNEVKNTRSERQIFRRTITDNISSDQHCHMDAERTAIDRVARRKLIVASCLCLFFMIGEATGGAIAHSLAIMTDAAHLLTDFASFLISLFALYLASRPATKRMSFGWYRAEVVGALISVLMIWLVTGILVYLAVMRIVHEEYEINGKVMLITAAVGVGVNLIMAFTLHQHGHTHGGSGHSHSTSSPGHSHGVLSKVKKFFSSKRLDRVRGSSSSTNICEAGEFRNGIKRSYTEERPRDEEVHQHTLKTMEEAGVSGPGDVFAGDADGNEGPTERENINVRAAFIHVIGDFLQSVGVMVAAFVIYFKPEYKIADPICTFIFSVLVLLTTVSILKDAMNILMEGTPKGIHFAEVRQALYDIPGVVEVHNLRLWSLTTTKSAVSVHLAISDLALTQDILNQANKLLRRRFFVQEVTIQMEQYVAAMADCLKCQELNE
uniref:Zinc transporter 2 n=1 Tax=Schistocephalus solidus TaxID=70667 RepID=A0A0X3PR40_SCHSO